MPKIDIDMFDDTPKVGDKVKVMGKVKFIDEDSGEVEVSYDDVSIVKKNKKRSDRNDNDDDDDDMDGTMTIDTQVFPQSQSLDAALGQAFPNTQ